MAVAREYGMSQASVWRHHNSCVIAKPLKADCALPPHAKFDTLGMMMRVANQLEELTRLSLRDEKYAVAVSAQGKLAEVTMHLHELQPKDERAVDLHKTPEFAELRAAILAALQPFPEALHAVTRALAPRPRGDS
jgi:hypothetical protein